MFLNYIMYNTTYYYMYYYYVNDSIHYILQIMDAILFLRFYLKPTQQTFGNPKVEYYYCEAYIGN